MTSEAKIYIILSKERKTNRYGPWIFHKNIFNHWRERFHVRPWLSRFTETRGHTTLASPCDSVNFPLSIRLYQSCFYPLWERTVRLMQERVDEGS